MKKRTKMILLPVSVLLILVAIAGYRVVTLYAAHQDIPQYVAGPYRWQLLYLQACAIDNQEDGSLEIGRTKDKHRDSLDALQDQITSCQHKLMGSGAGYYVYDFNIRRSVRLSQADMKQWKKYNVLSFPASIDGRVENNKSNEFNTIIPFERFKGFDYDCVLATNNTDRTCKKAHTSCKQSSAGIQCTVFNHQTRKMEEHLIQPIEEVALLIPQGFIIGPDLFKMLKPRFFPLLSLDQFGM